MKAVKVICTAISIVLLVTGILFIIYASGAKQYNADLRAIKKIVEDDGTYKLQFRGISLCKGRYRFDIAYKAKDALELEMSLDNDTHITDELPETLGGILQKSYNVTANDGTDRGRIDISCPKGSEADISYITINSDSMIYSDGVIWGVLMLMLIPCVWGVALFYEKSERKAAFWLTLAVIVLQILPFIVSGGLHLGTDTRVHMMRIEGIYYGLLDQQFPVVIYPEWNNSYGQIGVLYPNLFLYIPAIFRLLGMSQLGVFKLFVFMITVVSALIAYSAACAVFKREWQVCLAVIVLEFDNMRLIDLLDGGRFGGALLAEMFYPLIVAGLINVFWQKKDKWYYLAFGAAGVFSAHVVSASLVCIAVTLFTVFSITKLKDKTVFRAIGKALLLFAALIFGGAVSFLRFYFTGWDRGNLQWSDFVETLFPSASSMDNVRRVFILVLIAAAVILVITVISNRSAGSLKGSYVLPVLVCGALLFLMSTSAFPWEYLRNISIIRYYTNMLQGSYRMLTLSVCFFAFGIPTVLPFVFSAEGIGEEPDEKKEESVIRDFGIRAVFILLGGICVYNYVSAYYDYFVRNDTILYYDEVAGEVESDVLDYLPAGTDPEWYRSDEGYFEHEGEVSSLDYERYGTHVLYSYTNSRKGEYAEFPKFYYDGYTAIDEHGEPLVVCNGDRNRTRVYLRVSDTPTAVTMWYHVPRIFKITSMFSFGMWLLTIAMICGRYIILWFRPGSGILNIWKN